MIARVKSSILLVAAASAGVAVSCAHWQKEPAPNAAESSAGLADQATSQTAQPSDHATALPSQDASLAAGGAVKFVAESKVELLTNMLPLTVGAKIRIESPTERLVAEGSPAAVATIASPAAPAAIATAADNPAVAPGLVAWRQDAGHARVAAEKSGRPVLLVQILGDLDLEFC